MGTLAHGHYSSHITASDKSKSRKKKQKQKHCSGAGWTFLKDTLISKLQWGEMVLNINERQSDVLFGV